MKKLALLSCLAGLLLSCQTEKMDSTQRPKGDQLSIKWELVTNMLNEENRFSAYLELKNNGDQELPADGWAIYFNQLVGVIDSASVSTEVTIQQVAGEFYKLQPTDSFTPLAPGDSLRIDYEGTGFLIKTSGAPRGFYVVFQNADGTEQRPEIIKDVEWAAFNRPEQLTRTANDQIPMWTPEWQYEQNEGLTKLPLSNQSAIIPTPQSVTPGQGQLTLDGSWVIRFHDNLEAEANYLRDQLQSVLGITLQPEPGQDADTKAILLTMDDQQRNGEEAYVLSVANSDGINIRANDPAGAFYGIQSLLALLPPTAWKDKPTSVVLAEVTIEDYPRYAYRGLHLDVSRNFHKKETVLRLLDLMATYKLNKFHFHLTDDEGWRLEIPEIPELTEIGAFRGHTTSEDDHLYPAYGSGPFPDPEVSHGSGFYSKADFLEILQYAHQRHIEVVPEFDFPGHARAAIKAMQARYKKYMAQGDEVAAKRFLLHDPNDRSVYKSVQHFTDNVVCVCQESTYQFLEQVVQSTVSMYQEAGVPFRTIHIGGDEVPAGVWEQSPKCEQLMSQSEDLNSPADLSAYFVRRFNQILEKHDLITAGWEEIALIKTENGYKVNPDLVDQNLQPYVWNNLWGAQDLSNRLANAGYPVVLCDVTNLYFDLAYNKDPREPGLHWGGFVDTRKAFEFTPSDVFKSTKADNLGNPFDISSFYKEMENLTEAGQKNILGIQGQLWSETIKGQDMLERAALPKLLGLAERAWAPQPVWAAISNQSPREAALEVAWNQFANKVGQFALPRLDGLAGGYHYRIPTPGARLKDGQLEANVAYPGLEIRYTTDGSEPTANSTLYTEPVAVEGLVKLKAFATNGRGSLTAVAEHTSLQD